MSHHHRFRHGRGRSEEAFENILLIGNPNVGKSVIFGLFTGKYVTVSNYPGTTVEVSHGNAYFENKRYILKDTPGVNSLIPMSEDEKVTRDILLRGKPDIVLQVGDSKNLKRTLFLTSQLSEMDVPVVLDLNMEDEARDAGITIDTNILKSILGIDVITSIAPERKGIKELKNAVYKGERSVPKLTITYEKTIEEYIEKITSYLPESNISQRFIAIMILARDKSLREWLKSNVEPHNLNEIEKLRDECQKKYTKPLAVIISEARLRKAGEIYNKAVKKVKKDGGSFSSLFGRLSMHPIWGIPILMIVLFGMYEFVGVFGAGTLVGLLEKKLFVELINPALTVFINKLIPFSFISDMLVGEYGLITMALTYAIGIILPITTTFFIAFAVLEDSGYLPRLAIMTNRIFNMMGLNGKAVLPMVLGLGCGTMAVMTTRILETKRARIIATFLLALGIPCAAQLGVIMGMLGAVSLLSLSIWLVSILGVLFLSGYLASKIIPGRNSDFFMEIPPIRKPNFINVAVKTSNRAIWYLKETVPIFIIGTFILFLLDRFGILEEIEYFCSPVVVGILGLPEKATEAFLIGFFRRDYGAAGLFAMFQSGLFSPVQTLVSLVTITLFVPCFAHLLMMIKERGFKISIYILLIVLAISIAYGGLLNWLLGISGINI